MSKIHIKNEDMAFFEDKVPQDEDISYSSYALIANKVGDISMAFPNHYYKTIYTILSPSPFTT